MAFLRFMASPVGRWARIGAGVAVIVLAFTVVGFPAGFALLAAGAVFIYVGVFNVCLLGPLFGGPLMARDIPSKPNPALGKMR